MTPRRKLLLAALVATGLVAATVASASSNNGDRSNQVRQAIDGGRAKNVIMLLGDGMGDSEITIARNYAKGAAGGCRWTRCRSPVSTRPTPCKHGTTDVPDYVTDSAASGTGWATGHKTYNNAISVDPVTLQPLPTILEAAQAGRLKTGNITTAELTDATPAVLDSHISLRGCQGPADMATCPTETKPAGGLGSIAEQTVDHRRRRAHGRRQAALRPEGHRRPVRRPDRRAAGAGAGLHGRHRPGRPRRRQAVDQAASVCSRRATWTSSGPDPLAAPYPGPAATACTESNPARPATEPHLSDMTAKAIDLLSAKVKRDGGSKGFFLQVEGASIDKQDHAENPCGQIGETVEFDQAVQVALDWAKRNPNTLVIVTADHGHTSQIVEAADGDRSQPGAIATLITHDGQPMVVNYATNLDGRSQSHTGTQVRIAAQGPQAANVVGITNQTDLFHTMSRALGLE